jgi:membrane protein required for beta-lactamase induction
MLAEDVKKDYLDNNWSLIDKAKLVGIVVAIIVVIYGINKVHSKYMVKEF